MCSNFHINTCDKLPEPDKCLLDRSDFLLDHRHPISKVGGAWYTLYPIYECTDKCFVDIQ